VERSEIVASSPAVAPLPIVPVVPLRVAALSRPEPELIRICLVCGAELQDRACKLICSCGYFLSCSDYL
jgi:hypothetical protein